MTLTLPTAPFAAAQTIFGSKAIMVFTPTTGSPFNVVGKLLDLNATVTTVHREAPGSDGINRPDRECVKAAMEEFTFVDIEEIDSLLTNLAGFTGKNIPGTATLWIMDQDDPTTSVRLKNATPFACSISLKSGNTKFGGGDFSKYSIRVLSLANAPIVFTPNATS